MCMRVRVDGNNTQLFFYAFDDSFCIASSLAFDCLQVDEASAKRHENERKCKYALNAPAEEEGDGQGDGDVQNTTQSTGKDAHHQATGSKCEDDGAVTMGPAKERGSDAAPGESSSSRNATEAVEEGARESQVQEAQAGKGEKREQDDKDKPGSSDDGGDDGSSAFPDVSLSYDFQSGGRVHIVSESTTTQQQQQT